MAEPLVQPGQEWSCIAVRRWDLGARSGGLWRIISIKDNKALCQNMEAEFEALSAFPLEYWTAGMYIWRLLGEPHGPKEAERSRCAECDGVILGIDYLCQECRVD